MAMKKKTAKVPVKKSGGKLGKTAGGKTSTSLPFSSAAEFFKMARPINFTLEGKPKAMGKNSFGWQKAGGRYKAQLGANPSVTVQCSGPTMTVLEQGGGKEISKKEFLRNAKPETFVCKGAQPMQFSTGSLGWHYFGNNSELKVGNKTLKKVQVQINCPILGTKGFPKGAAIAKPAKPVKKSTSMKKARAMKRTPVMKKAPVMKKPPTTAMKKAPVPAMKKAPAAPMKKAPAAPEPPVESAPLSDTEFDDSSIALQSPSGNDPPADDDLKRISGVNKILEHKLIAHGIRTFKQLFGMSEEQREDIEDQLKFKGRMEREEWKKQAKALAEEEGEL